MTESIDQRFGCGARAPHKLQWLSDKGPGYTARDTIRHGRALGFNVCTKPAYSPQSSGMAEAFVKTFKRDYVYVNEFRSAEELRAKLAGWFNDCNANALHKGLKVMSPKEYQRSLDHAA